MNTYKKIISWCVISSLFFSYFWFSHASIEAKISLTSDEKWLVEKEILTLQSLLFDTSKSYIETLTHDLKKLTSYEEKGNSKIDISLDENFLWTLQATFDFNNYIVKNNLLDSDISGNISLKTNYQPTYGNGFEWELSTFASLIQKDGEMYALLRDLNFQVNNESISWVLDSLKAQFSKNTYLKIPSDENTKMIFGTLQNLSLEWIFSEWKNIFFQPLLQAYQKSGNTYYLVPTQYACEKYFELEQKLQFSNRWYTPKTCSSTVYQAFVKEFVTMWELYLTLWDGKNTFWYYFTDTYDKTTFDFSFDYSSEYIENVDIIITPDQSKYKDEWFSFHYQRAEFLKSYLNAESGKYTAHFEAELDQNNHFISIDSYINFNKDFVWEMALKNKKLTGFYIIKERGYDYNSENWDYKLKNVYAVAISWKMKEQNILQTLWVKFAGVDIKSKQPFLIGKTSYNNWDYTFSLTSTSDYESFEWKGKGSVSKETFSLQSNFNAMNDYHGKFNMSLDTSSNKNNAHIDLRVNNLDKNIFQFIFNNEAKREYKENIKIEAPSDYQEFDISTWNF